MEAIREIHTVKDGVINMQLPESFWGQSVEVIVLPVKSIEKAKTAKKSSQRGALKAYANAALQSMESQAWSSAIKEKHGID